MSVLPWLLPSLLAITFWGVSMFMPKLTLRSLPPLHLVVYSSCFFFIGALVMQAFNGFHIDFDAKGVMLALAVGVVGTTANLLYIFAIRTGAMSRGIVVTSLYPAVAAVLAFYVLGEDLTMRQTGGIILGMGALVLMVTAGDNRTVKE